MPVLVSQLPLPVDLVPSNLFRVALEINTQVWKEWDGAECGSWTSAAEMAPRRFPLSNWALTLLGSILPGTFVEAGNKRAAEAGLSRLQFQEGAACHLEGVADRFVSPMTWGVESHIVERFGQAGVESENTAMVKDTFYFISPDKSPTDLIESFRRFYGPAMNAFQAAEKDGKADSTSN